MKKIICMCFIFVICFSNTVFAESPALETSARSVLLMEKDTKEILYEDNADEQLPIASVTKIMTMLLITEAIDSGKITLEDMVPVSERAMSMGGSTMFLEAGEALSVNEMLKGIAVASANDGCVAMAEYISGSVEEFVNEMNKKAEALGMTNTHFVNTNGLDADGHYSSARDVAVMSAELLNHDEIFEYTTIWTDKMHDGKFDLSNTNKLIRFYQGANGLKTGSTSKAQCCISATAKRDDMQLIAVVLGAPTSNDRFKDARTLLDHGFANYAIDKPLSSEDELLKVNVEKGKSENVGVYAKNDFTVLLPKSKKGSCQSEIIINDNITAPVAKGDILGKVKIFNDDKIFGEIDLIAGEGVDKKSFGQVFCEILTKIFR